MNDTTITFCGWVGSEVAVVENAAGVHIAGFRVGSTPRRLRAGRWEDGDTLWHSVKAFRSLAVNCGASLKVGDPVVVSGKLVADVWKKDDGSVSVRHVVVASSVGHDLNRGTSRFTRAPRPQAATTPEDETLRNLVHSADESGPRLESTTGQVVDGEPASGRGPAGDGRDGAGAEARDSAGDEARDGARNGGGDGATTAAASQVS